MSNMTEVLRDILEIHAQGVSEGVCACTTFPNVSKTEGFMEATDELMDTLAGILAMSEALGASQEQITASVGHFLTVVLAVGYSLGAQDAYDVTLLADINVPDDIAEFEYIEDGWERPGQE